MSIASVIAALDSALVGGFFKTAKIVNHLIVFGFGLSLAGSFLDDDLGAIFLNDLLCFFTFDVSLASSG